MSVTKLKTRGAWWKVNWESMAIEARHDPRARVITGMLTGADAGADPGDEASTGSELLAPERGDSEPL